MDFYKSYEADGQLQRRFSPPHMCGRDTEVVIRSPILFRLQKASVWETSYQGFGP